MPAVQLLSDHPTEGDRGDVVEVADHRARFLTRQGYATAVDSDTEVEQPSKSANKPAWIAYAKSRGATDEELANMSKPDIIETYSVD